MDNESTSNPKKSTGPGRVSDHLRWATADVRTVLQELKVSADEGLASAEADRRLDIYGPNRLEETAGRSFLQMLMEQITEPLVLILVAAALLSAVLGEWADVVVILLIVALNALLGASQERRAEASLAALSRMGAPTARVVRDSHVLELPAEELVPGDVILLEAGDSVPADARVLEAASLRADESTLTGESQSVEKGVQALDPANVHGLGDLGNLVFNGTTIAYGRGRAVVYATGMGTALGQIAGLLAAEPQEQTPLQRRMAEVGRTLGIAAGVLVVLVFVMGIIRGQAIVDMLLMAISLAVAAIPEGLLAIVTIVLALGVQHMAAQRAIIRRLPAVETLGTANVIASDKTGTLTLNRMTVTHLVTPEGELDLAHEGMVMAVPGGRTADSAQPATPGQRAQGQAAEKSPALSSGLPAADAPLLANPKAAAEPNELPPDIAWLVAGAALANDSRLEEVKGTVKAIGDPTETALLELARRLGVSLRKLEGAFPRLAELPFDSERKRMTTFHRPTREASELAPRAPELGEIVAFTKGAPDVVLEQCRSILDSQGVRPLTDDARTRILEANDRLAGQALRVLAVACRAWPALPEPLDTDTAEQDLVFLGLVGMFDPPRPEVAQSIREAKEAGIRTIMVTGDHATTAAAIAKRLNLVDPHEEVEVISGRELETIDDEALREKVQTVSVFARVSPEHKLRIVRALKANGAVVAVTGDGVNDAPALKGADIGCAMGITGTDVSREAADMVLADDNYATIVSAVREGRIIYANIRKAVHYLLSCNIGEIVAIFFGIAFGLGSPLTPIQILWVNLVTDGLPALALGVEPAEPGVMARRPRDPNESIFGDGLGGLMLWQGVLLGLLTLGVYWWGLNNLTPAGARTLAFATLAFTQLAHSFNVRSAHGSLFQIGWFSNQPLLAAVAASALLQTAVMVIPFLAPLFNVVPLTVLPMEIILPAAITPLVVVELYKAVRRRVARYT